MNFHLHHSQIYRSTGAAVAFYLIFQAVTPPRPALAQAINPTTGYRIGAGDQIQVTVFGYEEYTGARVILPDGTFSLPLLGAIQAAGKTPDQLTEDLTAQLRTYLVDPVVSVSMTTLRPVVVTVGGEVQRPGPVQLRSLTTVAAVNNNAVSGTALNGVPTVSSALIEAGGITQNANIREITLTRTLPGNERVTIPIDLWSVLWSEEAPQDFSSEDLASAEPERTISQDVILQDGDSIRVPRLAATDDTIDRRLIARSSLSPSTVRVRIVGEVNNPGEVQLPPNSSLSSAVAIAGGPTDDAKLRLRLCG